MHGPLLISNRTTALTMAAATEMNCRIAYDGNALFKYVLQSAFCLFFCFLRLILHQREAARDRLHADLVTVSVFSLVEFLFQI